MCILSRCIVRCTQIRLSHPTSPASLTVPLRENIATDEKLKHILRASLGAHVCCWTSYCTTAQCTHEWISNTSLELDMPQWYTLFTFNTHHLPERQAKRADRFSFFEYFFFAQTHMLRPSIQADAREFERSKSSVWLNYRPRDVQMAFLFYFGPKPIRRNLWLQAHFNTNQVERCHHLVGQWVVSHSTMNELSVQCWRRYFIFLILVNEWCTRRLRVHCLSRPTWQWPGDCLLDYFQFSISLSSRQPRAMLLSTRKLWLYDASPQNNKPFVMCRTRNGRKHASCSCRARSRSHSTASTHLFKTLFVGVNWMHVMPTVNSGMTATTTKPTQNRVRLKNENYSFHFALEHKKSQHTYLLSLRFA